MKTTLTRARPPSLQDRLIWQCAALLLRYPDGRSSADELLSQIDGPAADLLARTVAAREGIDLLRAQADYVDTFDLRRRCTMYLSYWTAGDTRNRGREMLAFAQTYRNAGVEPPGGETPDFLPMALEFAATVDPTAGRRLLREYRVPITVLRDALGRAGSPYVHAVAAVCQTLPAVSDQEAHRLTHAGPPTESVGLQPLTLTVPPRG
ncbi:nitrate reductase molybdenum cofactor assembly chaperone [Mycobacterium canetti]|uniref:nitrate reductase molybdenum cofactor assembly chaperone n=1 Tax=Mycobacterium canetti TaxID=78331 RepID=UPI001E527DB9|nr:nitrate reductase molybdenum cofactor assembly chaperone [Mycobacterium canetti]